MYIKYKTNGNLLAAAVSEQAISKLGADGAAKLVSGGSEYAEINETDFKSFSNPSLDTLRKAKKSQLRLACDEAILTPFQSSALGSEHSYDCTEKAQTNLHRMVVVGNGGMIWTSANEELEAKHHGHDEAVIVIGDMESHIQLNRFEKLMVKIERVDAIREDTASNRELLESITW